MSIEVIIREFLSEELECPVWLEIPKGQTIPQEYVLVDQTGGDQSEHINSALVAVQSYSATRLGAITLNEAVKDVMTSGLKELPQICRVELNSDHNFTDTQTKEHRYQSVFDITYY